MESFGVDIALLLVGQGVISLSCRFDLLRVGEGHALGVGQGVDRVDSLGALGGDISLGEDQAVIPRLVVCTIGTDVDIVLVCGLDRNVVTHAIGVPGHALAGFCINYLVLVGSIQRDLSDHILAVCLGVFGEPVRGVYLPVGEGADEVVAGLVLRDSVKGRGVGDIAGDSGECIGCAVGVGAVGPAGEGVGEVVVLCLFGHIAAIGRGSAVLNRVCFES